MFKMVGITYAGRSDVQALRAHTEVTRRLATIALVPGLWETDGLLEEAGSDGGRNDCKS